MSVSSMSGVSSACPGPLSPSTSWLKKITWLRHPDFRWEVQLENAGPGGVESEIMSFLGSFSAPLSWAALLKVTVLLGL